MDELNQADQADQAQGDSPGITSASALLAALEAGDPSADPVGEAPETSPPVVLVRARWVGLAVGNPAQGLVRYGDPIEVTEEQLADDNTLAIPWADDWSPDPELAAVAATALAKPEEG